MSDERGGNKGLSALRPFLPAAWVVLGWLGLRVIGSRAWDRFFGFVGHVLFRVFGGFPAAQEIAEYSLRFLLHDFMRTYGFVLGWATFLLPLAFVARLLARSRIRAGGVDPLEKMRASGTARPRLAQIYKAIPAALWALALFEMPRYGLGENQPVLTYLLPALLGGYGVFAALRAGIRPFLAPTIEGNESSAIEIGDDEIVFDAVAVTRETRAAVGGLAGLSLAMVVWLAALPLATLFRDPRLFAAVAAYVSVALGGALLFRRASRVAVGVDGVRVAGTSRTRFFSYRDIDGVRVVGGDSELLRRDRVMLRLQLHGADAVRREAVCARIRENIAHVMAGKDAVAAQLVASSSKEQLARVASGGADYRAASLSREALWELIEGPAVDAASRQAAAEALAQTNDAGERARLRVAAEHCADPRVRVALEQLAERELDEAAGGAGAAGTKQRATSTLA